MEGSSCRDVHAHKQTNRFLFVDLCFEESLNCNTLKQISPQRPGSPRQKSAFRQTRPALQDCDATPGDMALPIGLYVCYIECICLVSFIFDLVCHRKSHSGHRRLQRFIFVESCVRAFSFFLFLFSSSLSPLPSQTTNPLPCPPLLIH